MKITAKSTTAKELTEFISQHAPGTKCYLFGTGASLLGFTGGCTIEDFLTLTGNPDIAEKLFVHVIISAEENSDAQTTIDLIVEQIAEIERHVYGFQVKNEVLGSFPAGMIGGVILHSNTLSGKNIPHGHLFVIPRVVISENSENYFLQLDTNRLLKSIKG